MNALNDRAILNLKPGAKEKKYFDGGGLYIAVKPNGKKVWRMAYRFQGVAKTYSIGEHPIITFGIAPGDQENIGSRRIETGPPGQADERAACGQ